ncbi:MAG: hypothetical protein ACJ73N_05000, partial [Bryobacteraceae bacterium]
VFNSTKVNGIELRKSSPTKPNQQWGLGKDKRTQLRLIQMHVEQGISGFGEEIPCAESES